MKRVLLFVIDACTSRVLGPAIERGDLPTFARLADAGSLDLSCTSIFPSITPAATASIVTGRYPSAHGIAGMSWIDPDSHRISYFGDDVWTIARRGPEDFLRGFLVRLNGELLTAPTLFETAERHGRSAGCFNYLVFRGDVAHTISLPWLLELLPMLSSRIEVSGPSTLCLLDFVADRPGPKRADADGGLFDRFGMNDDGTAQFLRSYETAAALPDFSLAYFNDYDYDSHDRGPGDALGTLRHQDELLAAVFDAWGGLDRVLDEVCIVMTADHSQSDVAAGDDTGIVLDALLDDWAFGEPDAGWQQGDELIVCPNLRAAEIYFKEASLDATEQVAETLVGDPRIDQVIGCSGAGAGDGFRVVTGDRGALRFEPAAGGDAVADAHGGRWRYQGDLAALDAVVDDGTVRFGRYPNAFERIAAGLAHSRGGHLRVTARPGYEFQLAGQDVHRHGGSHGSLHELDSIVPLLVAGAPDGVAPPTPSRIVDVEPFCRLVLGLEPHLRPGSSHAIS